ncbi:glycerol-3-phosphate 1-O-acyltransferase PlsY [Desulfosediminicola flagellatus]|uniref:glycerol-3-phosphate 1-O-acyltransferase PlsY n=1 Tax=Desulfosediminicola flagellatus TaxID=2569541 RepID=UPI0010AC14C7|nr:glycerol-3-phosphate 1-O-acyltransferase PlsY [Desulfosediminicola flagellatus]
MSIVLLVASYLIGAIPFGLVIGKFAGKDVREEGSKNIGATNVSRLLGKKLGFATLVCDCLKGFLPMLAAEMVLGDAVNKQLIVCLCGLLAVVGHMFPVYLGFKGGKGVATGLGVFLYLSPMAILISLGVFAGSVALSGFVSVGSLLSSGLMVLWLWLLGESSVTIITAAAIAALIWIKHHENIGRLLKGEEKSWKKK